MAFIIVVEVSVKIKGNCLLFPLDFVSFHISITFSSSPQHVVYLTKFVLSYVIPDVPYAVKEQMKREKYLTQVIIHEANLKLVTKRLKRPNDVVVKETEDMMKDEMDLDF